MDQPQNLISSSDLIPLLVRLDDPLFNILVNHLKNQKELTSDSGKLGRFLRLRRLDPSNASKEFVAFINSSSKIKEHFIEALFENSSDLIRPELFLVKNQKLVADLQEINHSNYIDPEIENSLSESYIYSSLIEEEIRPPIPRHNEQLIQSLRPNYLPLDQLIQKFGILESAEIEDIWRQLTESKLILPQLYQTLLNKLIINKDSSTRFFLIQVDQNERLLRKMADLLWNCGVNIYSPEESTYLDEIPTSTTTSIISSSSDQRTQNDNFRTMDSAVDKDTIDDIIISNTSPSERYLNQLNKRNPIYHNTTRNVDQSVIQSWLILKQNISIKDREMIGNWIGLSEKQLRLFREKVGSVSSFLPDRAHIIRAIDVLKTKYDRPAWLVNLARKMKIRLGYPPSRSGFNSVRASYKLTPIKIDF